MGDIAEGILNGDFDEITGEYLGEGMGFPRSIHNKNFSHIGNGFTNNPIGGITKYLIRFNLTRNQKRALVKNYSEQKLNLNFEVLGYDKCCIEIQKQFGEFVKFVKSENAK